MSPYISSNGSTVGVVAKDLIVGFSAGGFPRWNTSVVRWLDREMNNAKLAIREPASACSRRSPRHAPGSRKACAGRTPLQRTIGSETKTRRSVPTRQELKGLARLRLREAEALHAAGLYDGAAYLAGYVVELALKARVCRLLGVVEYPSTGSLKQAYAVHDLDQLVLLAGLRPRLGLAGPALFRNWSIAQPWKPDRRYTSPGTHSRQDALDILTAIRDPRDGILRWIAKYW